MQTVRLLCLVALVACGHAQPRSIHVNRDLLGANQHFDYLGDDDDSDDGGGSPPAQFDATPASPGGPFAAYSTISVNVNVVGHNGPQTNGSFTVNILGEFSGDTVVTGVSTTALASWSQTGWSRNGNTFSNTFTKASLIAEYSATVSFDISTVTGPATIFISTADTPPATSETSGNGAQVSVSLGAP